MFERTYREAKGPSGEASNFYVDDTLAFLRRDKPALEAAIAGLSTVPRPPGWDNAVGMDGQPISLPWPLNLDVLQGLLRCWTQPYSVAYVCRAIPPLLAGLPFMTSPRFAIIIMGAVISCCATSSLGDARDRNIPHRLLTGDELRSAIVGKAITFPEGQAITGYRCYIFERGGEVFTCRSTGQANYGAMTILEDRVCAGIDGKICWQFYRDLGGGYFIRHLALSNPQPEPICREDWLGLVKPYQLPTAP